MWFVLAKAMGGITDQAPVAGSKDSALATAVPENPPTTRTLPSSINCDVCWYLLKFIGLTEVQEWVQGSKHSTESPEGR